MRTNLRSALIVLALALGSGLLPRAGEAASVRSVQTGTTSISGPTNTVTVAIASVDTAKSFLLFQTRHNSNRPVASMVRGRIASATSLEFVKVSNEAAGAGVINIRWYVVEFEGGVRVQRGEVAQSATTVNVGISAVASLSQAFVTWSKTPASGDGAWNTDDPIVCELTTTSNLQCRVNTANTAHIIWWQVVEFTDAASVNVQKGTTSMLGTALTATATLTTAVDTSKTFVLASFRGTTGNTTAVGALMMRARLTGPTTISFDRDISGTSTDLTEITWQAVELKDGSSVQGGNANFASAAAQTTAAISSVDTSRSVAFASVQPVGGQNMGKSPYAGDDIIGVGSATLALSSTQITLDRNNTAAAADIGWFVVQFFKCAAVADASYVSARAQAGTTTVTVRWSSVNPVLILRKSSPFGSERPENGKDYSVGATGGELGTAVVVFKGAGGETSFSETGPAASLNEANRYYYKVFPRTGTGGGTCFAPGVDTVNASPPSGSHPAWGYMMGGGSILKAGIAGNAAVYSSTNASRVLSLDTATGRESWTPVATNAAIQGWLTWLPVGSARLKGIQSGTATMPVGATATTQTVNVTISSVDPAKAVLFFSMKVSSVDPADGQVRGQLTSPTTIRFERANDTSLTDATIRWHVVEFYGGVSVQRGTLATVNTGSTVTLSSAVDLTKSFALISCSAIPSDVTYDSNDFYRARLVDATTLEIVHGGGGDKTCDWQVVQHAGASVQRGTGTLASTATSSGNITISSVDLTKSFVHATWTSDGASTATGANFLRARLTGSTTVVIDRLASGGTINYAWEVVSFTDGTQVRSGTEGFTSSELSRTDPMTAVDTTRAVPLLSAYQRGGHTAYTADDNVGPGWFTIAIETSTTVRIERQITGSASADAAWFVLEFPGAGGAPTVLGGDQSGRVYSLDATLGLKNWEVTLSGADFIQAAVSVQVRAWSNAAFQAAYSDDVIFVATRNSGGTNCGTSATNNKIYALRASDGAALWTFNGTCADGSVDWIVGQPWVDYGRNRLYVASRAGTTGTQPSLWVINTLNGSLVASFALGHLETSPTMSWTSDTLYVGSMANSLHAINLDTLAPKWQVAMLAPLVGFVWEDAATPRRLYFATSDGLVWCRDDTGSDADPCPGWVNPTVSGPSNPLLLDKLYVGSSDGKVHQINLATGADEKQFTVGDGTATVGDLSTEDGAQIFAGTSAGKLYKLPLPLP